MRVESDHVYVEYTDLLLVISTYIRRYKFTHKNIMPSAVVVEVPVTAYDLSNMEQCLCMVEEVEGEPPDNWFRRAVRYDLQAAPKPVISIGDGSVDVSQPPPMKPIHTDSMVKVRPHGGGEPMETSQKHDESVVKTTRPKQDKIETITGEFESGEVITDPDYYSKLTNVQEVDSANLEGFDDTVPSGLERTGEHDRALEAISSADSHESESDGDE